MAVIGMLLRCASYASANTPQQGAEHGVGTVEVGPELKHLAAGSGRRLRGKAGRDVSGVQDLSAQAFMLQAPGDVAHHESRLQRMW